MKKCPFCAEEIRDEAIKCKHCGEMLTTAPKPSAVSPPPQTEPPTQPQPTATKPTGSKVWMGCLGFIALFFVVFWIADYAGCEWTNANSAGTPQHQELLKAMGPDNPIAKRINSLSRDNAYQVGVNDGAKDSLDAFMKMNWDKYDYHRKLRELRDLKATAFDLLRKQNHFDPVVFEQYRQGWDYGASTFSMQ